MTPILPTLLTLLAGQASEETPKSFELHGYVDVDYALNANRPADGNNFVPGTGTTAKRANEVTLNLAAIDLSLTPRPVGARLILNVGTGATVVHAGEPDTGIVSPEVWRLVQQASVIWKTTDKLELEAGIFPCHIGFEVLPSKDNWTYTRSWMGEFSPYYSAGLKATYAITPELSAQVHLMNGWQLIGDNNRAKSVGAQLAWANDRVAITLNGMAGPELANDDAHWRTFGDLIVKVNVTSRLQLAAMGDLGHQQLPGNTSATWRAVGVEGRYAFTDAFALAARGEWFDDPENGITGTPQTLTEGTLTAEVRPHPNLILKLEGRYDHSTADVFSGRDETQPQPDQALVVLGAVATF